MYVRQLRSIFTEHHPADLDPQPVITQWQTQPDHGLDWLASALAPFGMRYCIGAQSALFAFGDTAPCYYYVETGKLLVSRRSKQSKAAVHFATEGSLFMYGRNNAHVASCDAVVDSVVLRIPSHRIESLGRQDPTFRRVLDAVHASEREFIVHSLGRGQSGARGSNMSPS
jgi:CRP-like cAMP-binding protein